MPSVEIFQPVVENVEDKGVLGGGEVVIVENMGENAAATVPPAVMDPKFDHVPQSEMANLTQMQALRKFWKPSLFCLLVSFGAMMDGYHSSIDGNIVAVPGFIQQFGPVKQNGGTIAINAKYQTAWGATSSATTIVANIAAGFFADRFGRKFNMWFIWVMLVLGTVVELVVKDWQGWLGAKVIIGLAAGFYTTSLVIYNSEIAPAQIRGGLLSTWALGNALGGIVGSISLEILATSKHPNEYKRVLYSEFAMEGMFLIALLVVPESPWHWARKGEDEKGRKCLRSLYGNVEDFNVDHEYELMKMTVEHSRHQAEMEGKIKWNEIIRGTNFRRFWISAALPMAGKLTGNPLVGSYTTYFFQLGGLSKPFQINMILLFICISFYTIDRIGRRTLLLGASCTISVCMLGIGISGFSIQKQSSQNAVIALTSLFFAAYATGIAPIGPSYQGETATPRLRAKTNSISQACGQAWGLIFAYTIPMMLSSQYAGWGVKAAFFFFCTNSILGVMFYFFMPEYKNRSYAELDELFERRIPARKFKSTKTAVQLEREQLVAGAAAV